MIEWIGKTTDMRKVYRCEGLDYKDLFNAIQEKYGFGNVIDEEFDNADKLNWSKEDYKNAIAESLSQCYYHEFNEDDEKEV